MHNKKINVFGQRLTKLFSILGSYACTVEVSPLEVLV